IGLLLAMGRFNPAYWLLAELPGFNLFRVPARWMALYSLGMAMLAGLGLQAMLHGHRPRPMVLSLMLLAITGLMLLARFFTSAGIDAADMVGPTIPTSATMLGWVMALAGLIAVIYLAIRVQRYKWAPVLIMSIITIELLAAGRMMPYHDLAPRDVYLSPSFTTLQMGVYQEDPIVPARILPVSLLNFDPGNRDALAQRYANWDMDEQAIFTAFVALKKQEMLFPNLPLTWGIPSVDGFGGGVLPTRAYTFFSQLLLPTDATEDAVDGRLSERLAEETCRRLCIPDTRYLAMADVGYLIADKTFDLPFDGIFYDTSLSQPWHAMTMQVDPAFQATQINLLVEADAEIPDSSLDVIGPDSTVTIALANNNRDDFDTFSVIEVTLPKPTTITQLAIEDTADTPMLYAVTLVDTRTGDFWQVPLDGWLRVLSSDIKIYARPNPLGRAYIVPNARIVPDTTEGDIAAIEQMRQTSFDPAQTVILHTDDMPDVQALGTGTATITHYENTRVEITAKSDDGGYLVLSDAYFPGWQATIDAEAVPIIRANSMFKAIMLPPGEHDVVFEFVPSWLWALPFGAICWVISLLLALIFLWTSANPVEPASGSVNTR
ncbi:MAG: YfhO family protein, partial [Anaerolineae bacterium]|nr:YfhO family protein [Anaerolineae bacterium]